MHGQSQTQIHCDAVETTRACADRLAETNDDRSQSRKRPTRIRLLLAYLLVSRELFLQLPLQDTSFTFELIERHFGSVFAFVVIVVVKRLVREDCLALVGEADWCYTINHHARIVRGSGVEGGDECVAGWRRR